ncbi:hypothetical protein GIB67_008423, partial [Kingdonia uniflora]
FWESRSNNFGSRSNEFGHLAYWEFCSNDLRSRSNESREKLKHYLSENFFPLFSLFLWQKIIFEIAQYPLSERQFDINQNLKILRLMLS